MQRPLPLAIAAILLVSACGGDEAATPVTTTSPAGTNAGTTVAVTVDTGSCEVLFGSPNASTGLDSDACRPERICQGLEPFIPPSYDTATIEALRARVLIDPPDLLSASPYDDAGLVPADTGGVCAVLVDDTEPGGYRLQTFPDAAGAEREDGVVTHGGACGACSSLQDLSVYLASPDLGGPVRACALIELGGNPQATLECITDLGFTRACAQIWAFNSTNTRGACLTECLEALGQPGHLPDGSINACLACDETQSGPIFKAVAGRTRRNSGIPSAICRSGEDVFSVVHSAYP